MTTDNAVIMRRAGDPADETAGRHRNTGGGIEIGPAVAPPSARDDDAEPIGRVVVGRAHEPRPPAYQGVVKAWLVDISSKNAIVHARFGEGGIRLPLQLGRRSYDGLLGV